MELDQNGSYVWNETAVESHEEEVIDVSDGVQNLRITIKIKEGLKMSGGTEVTAANYLAYILAFSSPVGTAGLQYNLAGQSMVGYDAFAAYDGTNEGVEGATKVFSGIRLSGISPSASSGSATSSTVKSKELIALVEPSLYSTLPVK